MERNLKKIVFCVCVCMCVYLGLRMCIVCRPEDNFGESVLAFHLVKAGFSRLMTGSRSL